MFNKSNNKFGKLNFCAYICSMNTEQIVAIIVPVVVLIAGIVSKFSDRN
jgi:hypothetical protein